MFRQIESQQPRLADEVYRQILEAIHEGAIAPRERIVQEKLANQFKISRTPVREALLRLEQEGVLVTSGRSGFMIREIRDDEVRDIYMARSAVEGYAARHLADLGDAERLDRIQRIIEIEEDVEDRTPVAYFNANRAIHRAIVEETGNRYLLDMFDNLWNRGTSFNLFAAIESIDLAKSLGEHVLLCDAMRTGDGARAEAAMIAHIGDGLELQLDALSVARREKEAKNG